MNTTKLYSTDISCEGCANAIKKALGTLSYVHNVSVDVEKQSISIEHEENLSHDELTSTLDKAGFTPTEEAPG